MLSIAVGMAALPVSPCLYSACLSCHHLSLAGCNVWSLTFSSTDIQGLFFFHRCIKSGLFSDLLFYLQFNKWTQYMTQAHRQAGYGSKWHCYALPSLGFWCFLLPPKPRLGSGPPGCTWPRCDLVQTRGAAFSSDSTQTNSPHFLLESLKCHSKLCNGEHLITYKEDPNIHLSSACPFPCSRGISRILPQHSR